MNLLDIIDAPSDAKRKAKAMGFDYQGSTVSADGQEVIIRGQFRCVCGKIETYRFIVDLSIIDPAYLLAAHGAFSEDHLRKDGYSEEAIAAILKAGT